MQMAMNESREEHEHVSKLPDVLLRHCLKFLQHAELAATHAVCRRFKPASIKVFQSSIASKVDLSHNVANSLTEHIQLAVSAQMRYPLESLSLTFGNAFPQLGFREDELKFAPGDLLRNLQWWSAFGTCLARFSSLRR